MANWEILEIIYLLFWVIILLTVLVLGLLYSLTNHEVTIKTDCFDNRNNKMDGITCDEKIYCGGYFEDVQCKELRK